MNQHDCHCKTFCGGECNCGEYYLSEEFRKSPVGCKQMKWCWLGIHKWNKWQMLPKIYAWMERNLYEGRPTTDWVTQYHFRYQTRECQNCGRTQSEKVPCSEEG